MAALNRLEADGREAGYDGLAPALWLNQKLLGLRIPSGRIKRSEFITLSQSRGDRWRPQRATACELSAPLLLSFYACRLRGVPFWMSIVTRPDHPFLRVMVTGGREWTRHPLHGMRHLPREVNTVLIGAASANWTIDVGLIRQS